MVPGLGYIRFGNLYFLCLTNHHKHTLNIDSARNMHFSDDFLAGTEMDYILETSLPKIVLFLPPNVYYYHDALQL